MIQMAKHLSKQRTIQQLDLTGLDWEERKTALRKHARSAAEECFRVYIAQGCELFPRTPESWGAPEFIPPELQEVWIASFESKLQRSR